MNKSKPEEKIILQKHIAQSGFCSRRQAEELIRKGLVSVNGVKAELGMEAGINDAVKVKGKIIKPQEELLYIALSKPAGYTCTNRNFKGEKNVFELISRPQQRLFVVGRLDKDSRGLVILTNDGDLTQKMTHPKFGHEKEYITQIRTDFRQIGTDFSFKTIIPRLVKGVDIGEGDGVARAREAEYLGEGRFRIVLAEGKKRQIRRMFKALGFEVADIQRVRMGKLPLGNLPEGKWKRIEKKAIMD